MPYKINPPQLLRTPTQFLNDREAVAFFDEQRTILFQMYTQIGNNTDSSGGLNSFKGLSSFQQQNIKVLEGLPEFTMDTTGFTMDTTKFTMDKVTA